MNIEGVNLSSLLLGNNAADGGASPLPEKGTVPESFSNTLVGQLALLSEANGQTKPTLQLQAMMPPQSLGSPDELGGLPQPPRATLADTANAPTHTVAQLQAMAPLPPQGGLDGLGGLLQPPRATLADTANAPTHTVAQLQAMVPLPPQGGLDGLGGLLQPPRATLADTANAPTHTVAQLQAVAPLSPQGGLDGLGGLLQPQVATSSGTFLEQTKITPNVGGGPAKRAAQQQAMAPTQLIDSLDGLGGLLQPQVATSPGTFLEQTKITPNVGGGPAKRAAQPQAMAPTQLIDSLDGLGGLLQPQVATSPGTFLEQTKITPNAGSNPATRAAQPQAMAPAQLIDSLDGLGGLLQPQVATSPGTFLEQTKITPNAGGDPATRAAQPQAMAPAQLIDSLDGLGGFLKQPIATPSAAFLERPKTVLSTTNDPNNPALQLQPTIPPQTLATADERSGLPKQKNGEEGLAALFGGYLPTAYKKTAVAAADKDTGLEATLQAFTDALATLTPTLSTDDVAAAAAMNNAAVLNAPAFVKPLPDGIKPDMPGKEAVIANGFLQKETALYPSTPDGQAFNLQNLDNTAPAEKTRALDKQAPILGADKTPAGVVAEMAPPHRQLDNRTDMPAMTRHLSHPGWGKELGEQIVWMNNKAIPAAEIKLNPAHLGPISVRIDVNQDQATIVFTAQHTEVKDAIEASIPKLREMLATQQLNLANVNISQNATSDQGRSQSQPQPQPQPFFKPPEHQGQGVDSGTDTLEKNEPDRGGVSKGLLSLYA